MIDILLSTYNGENYLREQLDSLNSQTCNSTVLLCRDDGSQDKTQEILKKYNTIVIDSGKNVGVVKSFNKLLEYSLENTENEYIMFCDQDDMWYQEKIEKTLQKMQELEKRYGNVPLLVHTDLEVVDENINLISPSFMKYQNLDPQYDSLNRLLLQNTITGCTMMINKKLAQLALPIPNESIMHDWWLGLVASEFGKIEFLNESTMKYRQHSSNSVGTKGFNIKYIINKFQEARFEENILQAKVFLERYRNKLDNKTVIMLEEFILIGNKNYFVKLKILIKYKLLKQGFIRNMGLMIKI